jgi:hypothetical protein
MTFTLTGLGYQSCEYHYYMFISDLQVFTDIHRTILPFFFEVKGVRVDMPRPFQAREKGIVTHPASSYPLRNGTIPWPTARISEYIIFTFVRDIHDKDMKSDINIRKQQPQNWTQEMGMYGHQVWWKNYTLPGPTGNLFQ